MSRTFAYVGCRTTRERQAEGTGIGVYTVQPSGEWQPLQTLEPLVNPSYLALNRAQDTLYTVHGDGNTVSAYRVDSGSGLLAPLNARSCVGLNPVHLDFARDEASLMVAGYASGTATRMPLEPDGSLGEVLLAPLEFSGTPGPHRVEQSSSHPHFIARYVTRRLNTDWHIVPDKGLDTVFAVRWPADGQPVVQAGRAREGAGPRHAAFHPALPLISVSNELDSTMTTWSFDSATGHLDPLSTIPVIPARFHGLSRAAGIVIARDGRALYVTHRGHDSIATIELERHTGLPGAVHWTPTEGRCPRCLCLGPDGQRLYVANENSHSIVQFRVDPDTGVPAATGRVIKTGSPVSIVFRTVEE
jgi:6-phosphogluconolactonase